MLAEIKDETSLHIRFFLEFKETLLFFILIPGKSKINPLTFTEY